MYNDFRVLALLLGSALCVSANAADNRAAIPDLSGLWGRNSLDFEAPTSGPGPVFNLARRPDGSPDINTLIGDYNNPILKPNAVEQLKRMGDIVRSGVVFPDPHNQCRPEPVPFILYNFEIQILQMPNQITILYMDDHQVRRIRMNATHPARVTPSAYGDSVGHYEGDTLVVDTVGIKVGSLAYVDQYGTPYSQSLHVIERYHLIDGDIARAEIEKHEREHGRVPGGGAGAADIDTTYKGKALRIDFTVDDPGVFARPWSAASSYRRPSSAWEERVCAENTRDYAINKDTAVPTDDTPDF